jgi:hypothetical protein
MSSREYHAKDWQCKEIRLALTRAGIATRPEKCLQTFRLVVTAQYIYNTQQPVPGAIGYRKWCISSFFTATADIVA